MPTNLTQINDPRTSVDMVLPVVNIMDKIMTKIIFMAKFQSKKFRIFFRKSETSLEKMKFL